MKIKITDKIVSIPPYFSAPWSRIAALHRKGAALVIVLVEGESVLLEQLSEETLDSLFYHHACYLENRGSFPETPPPLLFKDPQKKGNSPIQFAFGLPLAGGLESGMEAMMQHNPHQKNAPDLPLEILQKVSAIAKIVAPSGEMELPQAEIGCNCFYCQMARALNEPSQEEESLIGDEELQFQQWNITQTGDKLYSVVNRLDEHEKYHVFLGQPVGCTCGLPNCEHILAVLKS